MHDVVIRDVKAENDDLLVYGSVDGVDSMGHGWVSRINHATENEKLAYMRELLINGKPADLSALRNLITPVDPPNFVEQVSGWVQTNWPVLTLFALNDIVWLLLRYVGR